MAIQRPAIGYGLGTFMEVYQQFAVRQFPVLANHAHTGWAEFAAEGGSPFSVADPHPLCCRCARRHSPSMGTRLDRHPAPRLRRLSFSAPWGLGLDLRDARALAACLIYCTVRVTFVDAVVKGLNESVPVTVKT
jgi:hypothetical protein